MWIIQFYFYIGLFVLIYGYYNFPENKTPIILCISLSFMECPIALEFSMYGYDLYGLIGLIIPVSMFIVFNVSIYIIGKLTLSIPYSFLFFELIFNIIVSSPFTYIAPYSSHVGMNVALSSVVFGIWFLIDKKWYYALFFILAITPIYWGDSNSESILARADNVYDGFTNDADLIVIQEGFVKNLYGENNLDYILDKYKNKHIVIGAYGTLEGNDKSLAIFQYKKNRLVQEKITPMTFIETNFFGKTISEFFGNDLLHEISGGKNIVLFPIDGSFAGAAICFDSIQENYILRLVSSGANLIVSPSGLRDTKGYPIVRATMLNMNISSSILFHRGIVFSSAGVWHGIINPDGSFANGKSVVKFSNAITLYVLFQGYMYMFLFIFILIMDSRKF